MADPTLTTTAPAYSALTGSPAVPTTSAAPTGLQMPAGYSASSPAIPNPAGLTSNLNTTTPSNSYTVASGDTLSGIASKNGMTLQQLLGLNPQFSANPNLIKPGQSVTLKSTPAIPSVTPAASSIQTTPSGLTVNGNTGGVVSTPQADNNPDATAAANAAAAASGQLNFGGAGTSTTTPTTSSTTTPAVPDLSTYAGAVAKLAQDTATTTDSSQPAIALQNLESGLGIKMAQTAGQPIPIEFITGQQKNLQQSESAMAAPLTQQLAVLQAQRTATLAADQAAVNALKPISTTIGTTLTSPTTGAQLGGLSAGTGTGAGGTDATNGASDAQILGYLQANGLQGTRYNMVGLINAVRQGYTAQDIISGKANVAGATAGAAATASNKSQFMVDGNGNLIQVTPSVAGAGKGSAVTPSGSGGIGAFSAKAPSTSAAGGSGNNMTFTLASDGKTVLANGTPVDLPTFKQLTGQTNVADNKVNFSMVQGNKAAPAKTTTTKSTPTTSVAGPSSSTGLSGSANQYFLSGDISKTGLGSASSRDALNTQVQNYASSLGINNWSAAKVAALNAGDAANYAKAIDYLTTTQRSVSNAESGFKQVLSAFPDLNKANSPLWNKTANELAATLTGGQRNAFEAGLTEIANEYSQVFSRGGANTVSSHTSASDVVNGNLSMKDLQGVLTELQAQGNIVVSGARNTVNQIMNGFGSGGTSSTSGGGSTYNGIILPN